MRSSSWYRELILPHFSHRSSLLSHSISNFSPMTRTSLFIRWSLITALLLASSISVSATVPTSPPTTSTAPNGGFFSQYFTNIVWSCGASSVLTGFDTTPAIYGTRICSPIGTLVAPALATFRSGLAPEVPGKVLKGFDPTTGAPLYKTSFEENGLALYYTTGNIGIGTSGPSTKLEVAGWNIKTDGQLISTVATGTPPLVVNSATLVPNLNAELLGGISSSLFMKKWWSTTQDYIPKFGVLWDSLLNSMIFDNGTNVGIGTTSPSEKLTVAGRVLATGFLYSSDRRLKDNITPLAGSLEKIMKLSGYSYTWKSTGTADIGIIAQEVETVYPDLVHTDASGTKSVEYANLIAPMIEAMKSQQREIEELRIAVRALQSHR